MKRVCSWCGKNMGEKEPLEDTHITHGKCKECEIKEYMEEGMLNPGSKLAKENGCTCDSSMNNYGQGMINEQTGKPVLFSGEPAFWKSEDCPLHGPDRFAMEETYGKERYAS